MMPESQYKVIQGEVIRVQEMSTYNSIISY